MSCDEEWGKYVKHCYIMEHNELTKQKAQEFVSGGEYSPSLTECFIGGAKWEHKRLVEKTWQWLKSHIKFETRIYSDVWDTSIVDIVATDFNTVDELEESFRKIMEE